jgi:adenylate cyclase
VLPSGGAEIDLAVMFVDIRGSTALGEQMGPREFAGLLDQFYGIASEAVVAHKGVIDKMIGDEVMALFVPSTVGGDLCQAAVDIVRAARGIGDGVPVGVGIHFGPAYVGKVGTENVNDFTAVGDTVNTTARLQGQAKVGEIVMSEAVYGSVSESYPEMESSTIEVKGRKQPVEIRVLRPD